jgi:hypothetical protein
MLFLKFSKMFRANSPLFGLMIALVLVGATVESALPVSVPENRNV